MNDFLHEFLMTFSNKKSLFSSKRIERFAIFLTMLVVYAPGFEIYEAQQGILSIANPSTLSRTFSYYGYFATFVAKSSFIQGIVIA